MNHKILDKINKQEKNKLTLEIIDRKFSAVMFKHYLVFHRATSGNTT